LLGECKRQFFFGSIGTNVQIFQTEKQGKYRRQTFIYLYFNNFDHVFCYSLQQCPGAHHFSSSEKGAVFTIDILL